MRVWSGAEKEGLLGSGAAADQSGSAEGVVFREAGSASILLHHDRAKDNWYSATLFIGNGANQFGPLYYETRRNANAEEEAKSFFSIRWS